jgi:hypothetical protein
MVEVVRDPRPSDPDRHPIRVAYRMGPHLTPMQAIVEYMRLEEHRLKCLENNLT